MGFYYRCIQRHLYAQRIVNGSNARVYLAKNPALTPKLDTVYARCPDAKVICLVRNPLDVVPSFLSMMRFSWHVLGLPEGGTRHQNFIIEMLGHWYRYPLKRLAQLPESNWVIVNYDDLMRDPKQTVSAIYDRFGFEMSNAFAEVLGAQAAVARHFSSRHQYSLERFGLTRQQIITDFRDIFERFGFSPEPGAVAATTKLENR